MRIGSIVAARHAEISTAQQPTTASAIIEAYGWRNPHLDVLVRASFSSTKTARDILRCTKARRKFSKVEVCNWHPRKTRRLDPNGKNPATSRSKMRRFSRNFGIRPQQVPALRGHPRRSGCRAAPSLMPRSFCNPSPVSCRETANHVLWPCCSF